MVPALIGPVPAVAVTGVSGSGKSTLAAQLAGHLGWAFIEGDDHHPAANIAKMSAGIPLTDADRWPWLQALADLVAANARAGVPTVLACSALRRCYRDRLRAGTGLVFLHADGPAEIVRERIASRRDHFMPARLLDSQLAILERLGSDEPGVSVSIAGPPEEVLAALAALEGLGVLRSD
jgi:gluconokinase